MSEYRIDEISDEMAVSILRRISKKWIEERGGEAFIVYNNVRETFSSQYIDMPSWLYEKPESASANLANISRLALNTILNGQDVEARNWVTTEMDDLEKAYAQFEPITTLLIGATIIGIILAARVKRIGDIEFYQGVPPEAVEIIKYASTIKL
jgi:hypothetical protein